MAKNLVIVESPAKVKTVKKYLGKNFEVVATKGHIVDLPKSSMGIDIENDFEPKYITIRGRGDTLAELKKKAKEADKVYLATDPDREGEAISWHLSNALNIDKDKQARITFNEITAKAVSESVQNPRDIDMTLVDSQQARRVLDRLVGYGISPILWSKIKRGLSAGRVQSAALRMICERDNEIAAFEPEEYWNLDASMTFKGIKKPIVARFYGTQKKKIDIGSQEELEEILKTVKNGTMAIESIGKSKRAKKAPNAFITSTMQQEAAKALSFTTSKTMTVAQHLYENGFITYLRTDSVRVSDDAINAAAAFIKANYGPEYSSGFRKSSKSGNKVQDAHEAIRPTDINAVPDSMAGKLDKDGLKLYTLIWKRFVASRMTDASYDVTQANFVNSDYLFKASCAVRTFDGFMLIYTPSDEEKEDKNNPLAKLTEDDVITGCEYNAEQHFTQAPPHYTEASLVKAMEEQGIGRPSTYAPTIATLLARRYIKKEKKTILMTELGKVTDELMTTAFPKIADIKFTANIEKELDTVEEGTTEWKAVIRAFYPDFKASLDNAQEKLARIKVKDEESDVICEKCGRRMVYKFGPHGKFLGCPGFPECRNTKPIVVKSGAKCPKCGKELVVRKTKKGRNYYACTGYPECDYMSWNKPGKDGDAKASKSTASRGRKTAAGASGKTAADS